MSVHCCRLSRRGRSIESQTVEISVLQSSGQSAESEFPLWLQLSMPLSGRNHTIHLEKTLDLLTDLYTEHRYSPDSSLLSEQRHPMVKQHKYNIELFLVADTAQFRKHGKDVESTRRSLISIAHHLRQIYSQLDIGVFLVGIEIWTEQDKALVTHSSIETLNNFLKWKETELVPRAPHDNVQLVSGVRFEENVLGEATMSTMCSPSTSGGVIQNPGVSTAVLSNYMAHEIGHNLGMYHDNQDCHCAAGFGKCLLAGNTRVFPALNPLFSDCSKTFLKNFLAKASASCLLDRPRSFIVTADLTKPNRPPLILAAVVSLFLVAVLMLVAMVKLKRLKTLETPLPSTPLPLLSPNLDQPNT
ncbi:snake venom metalloproteinase hemorrhagic factor 2-like [Polyodon spathula]|uniref:snake venom metalloproteinase hemorrhagic factor 2-like n=1 Tax=Polyodon spathula TaxID=7913 RepID=UPI001B7F013D|nr:snake venom metalloproteinase hemorrhagic factor 2-like [Polyodon spathula]